MSTQPLFNVIYHSSWRPHTLGNPALAHNADSYDDTSEDESGSDAESSSGSEGYMTPSESSELETCPILDLFVAFLLVQRSSRHDDFLEHSSYSPKSIITFPRWTSCAGV